MRLLFVSGTTVGGSGRSQRELANQLVELGHELRFLVDPESTGRVTRWWYEHLSDLAVRAHGRRVARPVNTFESIPGRRCREVTIEGLVHFTSPVPENAAPHLIESFRPDVVVGSSIPRLAWRKIGRLCAARRIPTMLYLREDVALNHLEAGARPADSIVANSESLARAVRKLGVDCSFIPSVVDTGVTATESSRRVALVVNPIESRGVNLVWKIAERLPQLHFVLQESWPLDPVQLATVRRNVERLSNLELRRAAAPGPDLYGDARVLLVPYRVDNRPRVIAEAQANGIPVVAADVPALVEAVGPGGIVVASEDIDGWCAAIAQLWADEDVYDAMVAGARSHSTRDEISPVAVARRFERLVLDFCEPAIGRVDPLGERPK